MEPAGHGGRNNPLCDGENGCAGGYAYASGFAGLDREGEGAEVSHGLSIPKGGGTIHFGQFQGLRFHLGTGRIAEGGTEGTQGAKEGPCGPAHCLRYGLSLLAAHGHKPVEECGRFGCGGAGHHRPPVGSGV